MELQDITKKISKYDFEISKFELDNVNFIKENIRVNFKKQRFDGWELYFIYNESTEIKIDFTLEIFESNRKMEDIVKFFEGGFTAQNSYLTYLFILLFKEGLFILKNEKDKIIRFLNWHEENSESCYSEFLRLKGVF